MGLLYKGEGREKAVSHLYQIKTTIFLAVRVLCLIENPDGKLTGNKEGKFEWVGEHDLHSYVKNHFESYAVFAEQINEIRTFKNCVNFQELIHFSSKF